MSPSRVAWRPLTEDETRAVFEKLANYVGKNLVHIINPSGASSKEDVEDDEDTAPLLRLQKDKVFLLNTSINNLATSVARPNLISLGQCLGKFTKSGKFKLGIGSLDVLARWARYKVWVKPNGELPFLYGNHVVKAHLGRITEDTPEHQGVVVLSMSDIPLGFGVSARSTVDTRKLDPTGLVVFHQADVGEYLRDEDTLF
ncbi:cytosolic large ribosomal subunit protein [Wallemia mellicola CBS 633.66]|uniref:60S ribosome subunit biogenesis protein NIP7 n=2 Tax=Wallemia mellicola TaxID=1708541 RepID=I4YF08_WALMC|nr:cytosolic large ribosomal subunit protein [Wallemia mellicola CBS 633.66]TIB78370.1 cytosolic large ribosomal subunit protein [Wallemia mellicola]EIM22550.1 cytosolic large ribosomal subunit protein [Wallemia mellicola CBS 633.66]TIB82932.1 cytosolic large ribosomal subunit protein [Wallemia mellicola]TIC19041.1 cytosolic large ribosomal subunit protein [Wallemia mellicola]TIC43309.1 cytosolic large ribosomal subunit protein [Wallemia mellicola]|eukprot:XP_006957220.1 cytosolic large ribosomal subunit protein [Wallemia mellicola CBS 633.66]